MSQAREMNLDALDAALSKLRGLTSMTTGDQGETFRLLATDLQEGVLWAISDLVDDAFRAAGT